MKKIIVLTLAFCAIALLPQAVSAQTETAPKQEKVAKKATPVVGKVNVKDGKVVEKIVPAQKKKPVKQARETQIVDFKPATEDTKAVKLIVKPLKGSNKKIAKPTTPQTKNLKQ